MAQTRTNKRTGEVQEMQPDGSWKTIVAPRDGLPALSVQTKPADPTRPATVRRTTNEADASAYAPAQAEANVRKTKAEIENDAAQIKLQREQFLAGLAEKGLTVDASGNLVPLPGGPVKPTVTALDPEKAKTLKALQDQVDRVGTLYRQNLQGGLPNVVNSLIPDFMQPNVAAFDSAAQGLTNPFMSAFRVPGVGSQSDTELKQFLSANTPSPGDPDAKIEEKLGNIQRRIDAETGQTRPAPSAPPNGEDVALANGKTRSVIDPVLRATSQRLGSMVAQNVPDDKILDFMKRSGIDPANTNIGDILHTRATDPKFKQWQRANPGKAYPIGPSLYTKDVPMSAARALGNMAAQSAPGAFLAASANGITGGYLDNMTDNPEMARTGMQLLRSQHPVASLAGDVAGYATDEALLGRIPGLRGLMATKLGRRGADALYGAFSGSGENDQDRATGALLGAIVNTGGGMAGRGLQRGVGATLRGIQNPDLALLHREGVPLTIGRIAKGAGDFDPLHPANAGDEIGKGVAGMEDRLAGFPGLDAVIGTARQRGDQGFNQAAFRNIAPGVTGTGSAGLTSAKAAETAAYSKLNPVRLSVDPAFEESLNAASAATRGLNHHAGDVNSVIADIRQQIADGGMTGKGYQTALQTIRKTRATLNDDVGGKAASLLTDLENNLAGLGERQGGNIAQDLSAANAIHGRREVMKTALRGGPAQGAGEMVSPKALNQASINNTTKYGGLDRALSSERPFFDLTRAGMKVMPNLTPDSGTAGRMALYPIIASTGGAGLGAALGGDDRAGGAQAGGEMGAGLGMLALGLGMGPYSRGGQRLLQNMLLNERPKSINVLGDILKKHPKIAGLLGSGLLRDYTYQQELPPQ